MEVLIDETIEKIRNSDFVTSDNKLTAGEWQKNKQEIVNNLVEEAADLAGQNQLFDMSLFIEGATPIKIHIQSGIINLPFDFANKMRQFFPMEQQASELKIYFITEGDINASKYRIDELANIEMILDKPQQIKQELITAIDKKIDLAESRAEEE